jgi:hypothetical protein
MRSLIKSRPHSQLAGHDAVLFQRRSDEIATCSWLKRATLPAGLFWSEQSRRSIADSLAHFAPNVDLQHISHCLVAA